MIFYNHNFPPLLGPFSLLYYFGHKKEAETLFKIHSLQSFFPVLQLYIKRFLAV